MMRALLIHGLLLLSALCINAGDEEILTTGFAVPNNCIETFSARLLLRQSRESLNPVDRIRDILVSQLDLLHLEYKILQAAWLPDGLLFEMSTPDEASEVLAQFNRLKDLGVLQLDRLESTVTDFSGGRGFGRTLTMPTKTGEERSQTNGLNKSSVEQSETIYSTEIVQDEDELDSTEPKDATEERYRTVPKIDVRSNF